MDWAAVSAISGMLATIAVVLSVVYLAIQVRRNTLATYSQAHHLTTIALAETASTIASSGELSRIYRLGLLSPDQLDEDEFFRFAAIGTSQFRTFENLFFQYRSGLVSEDFWAAHQENILWFYHCPGMQIWWKEKRMAFAQSFREFLEASKVTQLASPDTRRI
jgi:hypothetical protein